MARVLDPRQHVRVHSGMPEHPKVEPLSDAAFRCLVEAWCLCRRTGNDGRIPVRVWTSRWKAKARKEVIEAGLAHADGDVIQMHDWLDHQPSAAELDAKRKVRAEAGRKGGKRSGETRRSGNQNGSDGEANTEANASTESGNETATSAQNSSEFAHRNGVRESQPESSVSDSVETPSPAQTSETGEANASSLLEQQPKPTRSKSQPDKDKDKEGSYVGGDRYVSNGAANDDPPPPKFHPGHETGYVDGCDDCAATYEAREMWLAGLVAATEPARHCPRHPGGTDTPCRECGEMRRHHERWHADRQRAAEERKRNAAQAQSAEARARAEDRARAIANCGLCDETGYAGARVCDHDPGTVDRARRGSAAVRAALAEKAAQRAAAAPPTPEPQDDPAEPSSDQPAPQDHELETRAR